MIWKLRRVGVGEEVFRLVFFLFLSWELLYWSRRMYGVLSVFIVGCFLRVIFFFFVVCIWGGLVIFFIFGIFLDTYYGEGEFRVFSGYCEYFIFLFGWWCYICLFYNNLFNSLYVLFMWVYELKFEIIIFDYF